MKMTIQIKGRTANKTYLEVYNFRKKVKKLYCPLAMTCSASLCCPNDLLVNGNGWHMWLLICNTGRIAFLFKWDFRGTSVKTKRTNQKYFQNNHNGHRQLFLQSVFGTIIVLKVSLCIAHAEQIIKFNSIQTFPVTQLSFLWLCSLARRKSL